MWEDQTVTTERTQRVACYSVYVWGLSTLSIMLVNVTYWGEQLWPCQCGCFQANLMEKFQVPMTAERTFQHDCPGIQRLVFLNVWRSYFPFRHLGFKVITFWWADMCTMAAAGAVPEGEEPKNCAYRLTLKLFKNVFTDISSVKGYLYWSMCLIKFNCVNFCCNLYRWPRGLCGFESRAGGHLSLVSVVCFQVEVSATGCSLVQRSPTECGVPVCEGENSTMMGS